MKNNIIKIQHDPDMFEDWELYSLKKIELEKKIEMPCANITFASPMDITFVLGEYQFENLKIKCGLRELDGQDRAVLSFTLDDETIHATGIFLSQNSFAIPIDSEFNKVRSVSGVLGQEFINWLYSLEKLTWD